MGLLRRKGVPEPVIDLREPEEVVTPPKPVWGSPVPCPSCGGRGYLDHIDPYREIMYQHCIECFTKYEIAKAELETDTATAL